MAKFIKATYHPNLKVAEFIADDGRHCLRSGGSLPWRVNNGGNLRSPMANGQPAPKKTKEFVGFAKIGKEHFFFIFPDYATGRAEMKASVLRKYSKGDLTEMMHEYAPPSDNNDTAGYIEKLSKLSGVPKTGKKIKDLDEAHFEALLNGIEQMEGFHAHAETRKEVWTNVTHIQATDGSRPVANEEVVVKVAGQEKTLKSGPNGHFPPIPHQGKPVTVYHKTVDGDKKKVGEIPADKGQHWSLLTKISEFFSKTGPVKAPEKPNTAKQVVTYTIQPKDTLSALAAKFKTSVGKIKSDNHLKDDKLLVGQILGIYGPIPPVPQKAVPKKNAPKKDAAPVEPAKKPEAKPAAAKPPAAAAPPTAAKPPAAKPPATPPTVQKEHATTSARSKEGKGEAIALLEMEDGVAPWMKYAVAEAKRHRGASEGKIEKSINYHTEINDGRKTLVGNDDAWCAAFANWCLMKAGYPIENPKESGMVDRNAAKGRANAFIKVRGAKTDKKQKTDDVPFVANPLYKKIDKPIFGAIAIVIKPGGHGKHAGFVYGKIDSNNLAILGGNQGDTVKFSPFNIQPVPSKTVEHFDKRLNKKIKEKKKAQPNSLCFLLPIAYHPEKVKGAEILDDVKIDELNSTIGIGASKQGENESTL